MIGRRIQPLLALCAAGAVLVSLRLAQIQIDEHELWAEEASRLLHSGSVVPYRRGRILDAGGRVLARDVETYELVLIYRELRRGHPLAQVAHARSLLEERAVTLQEARERLPLWGLELARLSPAALAAFAEGRAIALGDLVLPATDDARRERRAARASDVRYYLRMLLDLSPKDWKALNDRADEDDAGAALPFVALAEAVRTPRDARLPVAEAEQRLEARLARSLDDLERLAGRLAWPAPDSDSSALYSMTALDRIVHELETARAWVEDATASKLFAEAAGFAPGRVDAETLAQRFDLDWIRRILSWDETRLVQWAHTTRRGWLTSWRDEYALVRLTAELRLPTDEPGPDEVLSHLVSVFGPEGAVEQALNGRARDWRELDELAVLCDLEALVRARLPDGFHELSRRVFAWQDPELRSARPLERHRHALIDKALGMSDAEAGLRQVGRALVDDLGGDRRVNAERSYELACQALDTWEDVFQARLAEALALVAAAARPDDVTADGRLVLAEAARERAAERAEFFLKDYGMRPRRIQRERPSYDVVYLLTRYDEQYPGILAREARERLYPPDPAADAGAARDAGARLAAELLGAVSSVTPYDLQRQRGEARRMRQLRSLPTRSEDEELELKELVGAVLLHDEVRGVSGIEGFWDEELRGRNGYREKRGLQDVLGRGGTRHYVRRAEDGQDLRLTLDLDLQRAAQRTLRRPEVHPEDEHFDYAWQADPVGAIVMIRLDGDVIAAASEPSSSSIVRDDVAGQREHVIDRTLRQPTFQPPGSVFKPFVAAYALDHVSLDPAWTVACAPLSGRDGAGYVDVRCHSRWGHGDVALRKAIEHSCNAYFAALGERLSLQQLVELAHLFGFGEPTGVRTPPPWDPGHRERVGLIEATPQPFRGRIGDLERRLAGNGLGVIEATPMQLARATAGLATGRLPSLRLVDRIGGRDVPRAEPRRIPLQESSLARVRQALVGVTRDGTGTALHPDLLGVQVAAKTGSADIQGRRQADEDGRVRKHTWVAGWAPAADPVMVFVVFVHDTTTTSSHGAVYVARQLLRQPEVRAWLAAEGVELADVALREGR